ncbi:MAG: hypothetical protein JXR94_23785, partial [Candidatus Hydrogenedentes bacterium]|nr:hypothetical protein [Candidatus Hydrogenedentota bacterium]
MASLFVPILVAVGRNTGAVGDGATLGGAPLIVPPPRLRLDGTKNAALAEFGFLDGGLVRQQAV